jgi:hypothetical protein
MNLRHRIRRVIIEVRYPACLAALDRRGALAEDLRQKVVGAAADVRLQETLVEVSSPSLQVKCGLANFSVQADLPETILPAEDAAARAWHSLIHVAGLPKKANRVGTRFLLWYPVSSEAEAWGRLQRAGLTELPAAWRSTLGDAERCVSISLPVMLEDRRGRIALDVAHNIFNAQQLPEEVRAKIPEWVIQVDADVAKETLEPYTLGPEDVRRIVREHWSEVQQRAVALDTLLGEHE